MSHRFIAIVLILIGCNGTGTNTKQDTDYVTTSNALRAKNMAPLIETNWIEREKGDWGGKENGVPYGKPLHLSKTIRLDAGGFLIEEDQFHFLQSDSIAFRMILIHRYDSPLELVRKESKLIRYDMLGLVQVFSKSVDSDYADSLLYAWGLINGKGEFKQFAE